MSSVQDLAVMNRLLRQMEYYFGDANLFNDRWLLRQMDDEGWISLNLFSSFSRIAAISIDMAVIRAALEKSEIIEVSEDQESIRRSEAFPLPENKFKWRKEQVPKTVYVQGFPPDFSMNQLVDFFWEFEGFDHVMMNKTHNADGGNTFKGAVFASFTSAAYAKKFLANRTVSLFGRELEKCSQKKFIQDERKRKRTEKKLRRAAQRAGENALPPN